MMQEFIFDKSKNSNVIKSIRFPEDLNDQIKRVVQEANKGKKTKEYSFNGFVVSACYYALQSMNNKEK